MKLAVKQRVCRGFTLKSMIGDVLPAAACGRMVPIVVLASVERQMSRKENIQGLGSTLSADTQYLGNTKKADADLSRNFGYPALPA